MCSQHTKFIIFFLGFSYQTWFQNNKILHRLFSHWSFQHDIKYLIRREIKYGPTAHRSNIFRNHICCLVSVIFSCFTAPRGIHYSLLLSWYTIVITFHRWCFSKEYCLPQTFFLQVPFIFFWRAFSNWWQPPFALPCCVMSIFAFQQ